MRRASNGNITKSAGKSRKDSSLLASQRASKVALTHKISNMSLLLANIDNISEEEKKYQFDNYEKTGDFEKDFISLSLLRGIKLTIGTRLKVPHISHSPDPGNEKKTLSASPSQEKIKIQEKSKLSSLITPETIKTSLTQEKTNGIEEDCSPKTFVLAKDTYNYFKPRLEMDTEFDHKEYVKALYIRGWKADMRVITVLARTLPELEKLTSLNMWNAGLDDKTLHSLGECLSSIPSLKTLILDGNSFVTNQEFDVFLQQPSKLNLQHLSLRHCEINEIGAVGLSQALLGNNHLLTLNLCFNKLGNEGVRHLAESLCFNRCLLSLNLGNNGVGDEGVKHIAQALSTFPLTDEQVVARRTQLSLLNEFLNESVVASQQEKALSASQQSHGKTSREKASRKKDGGKGKGKGGKANWDKVKTPKNVKTEVTNPDDESVDGGDSYKFSNPLLEKAILINGDLWLPGNRSLINLNLSRNKISKVGLDLLYATITYQGELASESNTNVACGLMKLSLQNNSFCEADATYVALLQLLCSRDPLHHQDDDLKSEENGA